MINDLRNMDYIELICDAEDEDSINVCVQIDDNHDIRIIFNRVFRGGSGMRKPENIVITVFQRRTGD